MERLGGNRQVTFLIGVGLVLVGLLAGILVMLFVVDVRRPVATATPQRVERVQLGQRQPTSAETRPADSPGALVEPMTLNRLFKEVADRVTPAVVFIQVESAPRDVPREWFHNFDEEARRRFFQEHPPRQSVGSGVIVSDDGYVVTNNHVIEGANAIQVTLHDKRVYPARVVGTDPSTDLAVIRLEDAKTLPAIEFGDSDELQVGEWVLAIGNPFRLTSTVTAGIVSALGRQVNIIEGSFRIEDFIQTDAAINPGNSGGALVDLQGRLVGISTAIATESGSYEGYGFAVPVNLMERVVADLIEYGEVRRGYLGVSIQDVDARAAEDLGLDGIWGVYVENVIPGGAADAGGVRDGDVVLAIDGRRIRATNELQSAVARRRPGDRLTVEVWRSGKNETLEVELLGRDDPAYAHWINELDEEPAPLYPEMEPDDPEAEVFELGDWGIGLRDLANTDGQRFSITQGAYVAYVAKGSPAEAAGLPRDVVIEQIAGQDVLSSEDALNILGDVSPYEETVLVRVRRRDGVAAFYELVTPVPAG